jgi:hypothetical protein
VCSAELFAWSGSRVSQRRGYSNRQNNPNRRAFPEFALGFDVAAVTLSDVFNDCQAKACPGNLVLRSRFIHAVKPLENSRQIVFVNSDAGVAHTQFNLAIALASSQPNPPMLVRILHGVIEQIIKRFL